VPVTEQDLPPAPQGSVCAGYGLVTIPIPDGPPGSMQHFACLGCRACTPTGEPSAVLARIARTGDVLLGAGPDPDNDLEW
jgi:hypothetical protein